MDISLQFLLLLPIGLGLLGFIEPCTVGGHLLFLNTQKSRPRNQKIKSVAVFVAVRSVVAGLFGALIAFLGQKLIGVQTGIWLFFGLIYLALGLVFLSGYTTLIKRRIDMAPAAWRDASNPALLGLAFGLNIPACAAPILFALLSLTATTGTVVIGFLMMFLFGLFLSAPLALFAFQDRLATRLDRIASKLGNARWITGSIFAILGLWSIWFGLFVDPQDWSGL